MKAPEKEVELSKRKGFLSRAVTISRQEHERATAGFILSHDVITQLLQVTFPIFTVAVPQVLNTSTKHGKPDFDFNQQK